MRILLIYLLCFIATSSFGQIKKTTQTKVGYSFKETKTFNNKPELLSVDEINGFHFDPVRNKAVVEFRFIIPSIQKYNTIYIEHGDTVHGFSSCMTIDLKEEKISTDTFTKIFLYPTAYSMIKIYRVKCITQDGTIRFYPFFRELHEGDIEKRTLANKAEEERIKHLKEQDEARIREWEQNKNSPKDESWRSAKPEIVSGGLVPGANPSLDKKVEEAKESLQLQLEKLKEMEAEIKAKMEELNKLQQKQVTEP